MSKLRSLPEIMIAPNGARRTRKDHPKLPITISEIIQTTVACVASGADGLHLHIRDAEGNHTLDDGLYLEALSELKRVLPDLYIQITTEAVGQYSPAQQRNLVRNIKPKAVSVSIAEMLADGEIKEVINFYAWCREENISVQHIIYSQDDLMRFKELSLLEQDGSLQFLFVLGRHAKLQQSSPDDLIPFHEWILHNKIDVDWAVCAFGSGETDCLVRAAECGGKIRIGFENSLWNKDGSVAKDNAERVCEIVELLR